MLNNGYFREDTIAAVATEAGGAICITRVSGAQAFTALSSLTRSSTAAARAHSQLFRTQLFLSNGEPLDDAMVVRFVGPQSYTGEDMVEFHTHGGTYIAQRLMETLISIGIRQALRGEFSFRAVRNGKMNLFQAQAVSDLIGAKNDTAVGLALEKLSGQHNPILGDLASRLRELAALGEIGIDFADQDVEEVSLPNLKNRLEPILSRLKQLSASYQRGTRIQEGLKAVFVGLPNAGKSSLFNALLGEERSIVSEEEGTTRDVVREHITLRGPTSSVTLRLEDTAGLRSTTNRIEKMGIERTLHAVAQSDLVLLIVDPLAPFETVQSQWNDLQETAGVLADKTIGILTKCDLVNPDDLETTLARVKNLRSGSSTLTRWLTTSASSGQGIAEASEAIVAFCEKWTRRERGEVILTRLDHLAAVGAALEQLHRAIQVPELELFAADVRQGLHSLGPLIGDTTADDILGKIFSDFCIGK